VVLDNVRWGSDERGDVLLNPRAFEGDSETDILVEIQKLRKDANAW
jgi:hypothetical protein